MKAKWKKTDNKNKTSERMDGQNGLDLHSAHIEYVVKKQLLDILGLSPNETGG